jgi:3-phenylpropionate/cinnamic acid dioxygenase small subunit
MTIIDSTISRDELETLYYDYANALDDELASWADFFTNDCLYKIVTRENYDRSLPLALMLCEGRGMVLDRVDAIKRVSFYLPRSFRHVISNIRTVKDSGGRLYAQANFVVFESFVEGTMHVFNAGRYFDVIVRQDTTLKFREKICVLDGNLIPGSLIFPI